MEFYPQVESVLDKVMKIQQEENGFEGDPRSKVVWHRDNFTHFLKQQDQLVKPITFEFWPSLSCNARCSMCPYHINQARQAADQTSARITTNLEIARRVAVQMSEFGAKSVLLTGGGEPFLNPEIDEIAQIMKENRLHLGIYTNGTVPRRDRQIRNLVALEPQFIRMSVNAGSAQEHEREYRIKPYLGSRAWEFLKRNALVILDAIAGERVKTSFGLGFILLGNEKPTTYLGIADFIREIYTSSGEKPMYAHIRPKFLYYHKDGSAVSHIPKKLVDGISRIPEMVDRFVRPNLPSTPNLKIQTNAYASRQVNGGEPSSCFSTGWCTSFNHLGEGYAISELCGTVWDGARWGDLMAQSMEEAWSSPTRLQIHQEYSTGTKKLPIYSKLSGVQHFLAEIRKLAPLPFSDDEVQQFWERFEVANLEKPRSWEFI